MGTGVGMVVVRMVPRSVVFRGAVSCPVARPATEETGGAVTDRRSLGVLDLHMSSIDGKRSALLHASLCVGSMLKLHKGKVLS